MEAFIYLWIDLVGFNGKRFYVGSHKGNPDDGYICSSKLMKEQYQQRPENFIRLILYEGKYEEIFATEIEILQTIDVAHNPLFYNLYNGHGRLFNNGSEEIRKKISLKGKGRPSKKKGRPLTEITRQKMKASHPQGPQSPLFGKPGLRKGKKNSEDHNNKIKNSLTGKKKTEEHIRRSVLAKQPNHSTAMKRGWETRRRNLNEHK